MASVQAAAMEDKPPSPADCGAIAFVQIHGNQYSKGPHWPTEDGAITSVQAATMEDQDRSHSRNQIMEPLLSPKPWQSAFIKAMAVSIGRGHIGRQRMEP